MDCMELIGLKTIRIMIVQKSSHLCMPNSVKALNLKSIWTHILNTRYGLMSGWSHEPRLNISIPFVRGGTLQTFFLSFHQLRVQFYFYLWMIIKSSLELLKRYFAFFEGSRFLSFIKVIWTWLIMKCSSEYGGLSRNHVNKWLIHVTIKAAVVAS